MSERPLSVDSHSARVRDWHQPASMAQEHYLQRLFTSSTPENERLRVFVASKCILLLLSVIKTAWTARSPSDRDAEIKIHACYARQTLSDDHAHIENALICSKRY